MRIYRATVFFVGLMMAYAMQSAHAETSGAVTLTAQSAVAVIVSDEATQHDLESAERLKTYLHRVIQAAVVVAGGGEVEPAADLAIHVGATPQARAAFPEHNTFESDEFVIDFIGPSALAVLGGSSYGTEFGVAEFLERYAHVRWLFPGELGEYVPPLDEVVIPRERVQQKPVYVFRTLSGLEGDHYEFCYRNRMGGFRKREQGLFYEFHHNLGVLVHPLKYAQSNPEYYPLIHGKRLIPDNTLVGWQPCLTNPDVIEQVAANITQHFRTHPEQQFMSLGINDNEGFCTCDKCLEINGGHVTGSNGNPSFSRVYYTFVNEVVRRVSETFPDKRYGLLAYEGVADPPEDFKLDPRVVPTVTRDRMAWIDPDIRKADLAKHEKWRQAVGELAWYDYSGGKYWMVPRVYFHQMAQTLRFGAAHGIHRLYTEASPRQGYPVEGPKLYLQLKLLWNPHIDVDSTLDEWYTLAVGPDAAPALREYFEHWESFWTHRVRETDWFTQWKGFTYLFYEDISYVAGLTLEDLERCDALMDEVVSRSGPTARQRERAELLRASYHLIRNNAAYQIQYTQHNAAPDRWRRAAKPVLDNDFDQGVGKWGFWKNNYTFTEQVWSADAGRGGSGAIGIDAEGERHNDVLTGSCLLTGVHVDPGVTYRLSVWYRCEDMDAAAEAAITIRWQDESSGWIEFMGLSSQHLLPVTERWTKVQVIVTAMRDTERPIGLMIPQLGFKRGVRHGKIWFDDLTIQEVTERP